MNLTNDSGQYVNEKNSSSDEEEDEDESNPSICIETFFSEQDHEEIETSDDDDDDDDDDDNDDDEGGGGRDIVSDIENQFYSKSPLVTSNRLTSILRQSNRLVELKLNCFHNNRQISNSSQTLRHALSDSEMSKRYFHYSNNRQDQEQQQSSFSSNHFHLSTNRSHRLYLPSSFLYDLQTQITHWLQASTFLIDSISTSAYHRRCWPQLLLTHFIERRLINLQFVRCTNSVTNNEICSIPKHTCVTQDEACKLSSILQKGSRFQIDPIVFDHLRRIIVIKSMQEVINDNSNLQQIYVKQLKCLKQSLIHQQSSVICINNNSSMNIASIYSKILLFLSSLYSIKSETMQTLFCQHLLHNPSYSYLIN